MDGWVIGAVIVKGKRSAVIQQVFPNVVAMTNRRGVLVKKQETLITEGWRLSSEALPPHRVDPALTHDSEQL